MVVKSFFYTLKQSFLQIVRNKTMSLASIFAITAMLLILGIFFILVINVNTAAQSIQKDYDSIEIFMLDDATKDDVENAITNMKKEPGVSDVYYKGKIKALDELKLRWGENAYLLDSLEENPLPNAVVIKIDDLEKGDAIAATAEKQKGAEDVQYYKDTVDKLLKATKFIQIAAIIIMIFLIVVSVVVVSNTIKLTVFNRANEINIMKYVGATNWFIRGPFLGEGIIIGIISAGISIGLSVALYQKVIDVLGDQIFSVLSMPMVPVGFLAYNFTWIFIALGVSIGASGSIISMRKFLNA